MSASPKGCLFLDACVVFAKILGESEKIMDKLELEAKRKGIPCYFSESVKVECERKLNFTETFFEKVFRVFAETHFSFCRQQLGKNPKDPLSKDDFQIFASLFTELRMSTAAVLQQPLRTLEIEMVLAAEDLIRKGLKMDFSSFLQNFIREALLLAVHIRIQKVKFITNEQGFFKKNGVLPDNNITTQLLAKVSRPKGYPFHKEDADNISSAWSHMNNTKEKTVFASFDFRTVISHAKEIYTIIGIRCADPLYAVHFL